MLRLEMLTFDSKHLPLQTQTAKLIERERPFALNPINHKEGDYIRGGGVLIAFHFMMRHYRHL